MYEMKVFVEGKSVLFVMNLPVKRKLLTSYASHPCFVIVLMFYLFNYLFIYFDLGFTALSRIFHLYRAHRFAKMGKNREKKHLTIRKQNLAFPHVTQARLEPQR